MKPRLTSFHLSLLGGLILNAHAFDLGSGVHDFDSLEKLNELIQNESKVSSSGATLRFGNSVNIYEWMRKLEANSSVILDTNGYDATFDASSLGTSIAFADNLAVTKTGEGRLVITGPRNSAATTTWIIEGGTLALSANLDYGTISGTALVKNGGTFEWAHINANGKNGNSTLTSVTVERGGTLLLSSEAAGTTLNKTDIILKGGTIKGSSSIDYKDGTIVAQAALGGSSETESAIQTKITLGHTIGGAGTNTFAVDADATLRLTGALSGSKQTLTKTGGGKMIISASNQGARSSYNGGTYVNEGTLAIDKRYNTAYGIITGPITVAENAVLEITGNQMSVLGNNYQYSNYSVGEINLNGGSFVVSLTNSQYLRKVTLNLKDGRIVKGTSVGSANVYFESNTVVNVLAGTKGSILGDSSSFKLNLAGDNLFNVAKGSSEADLTVNALLQGSGKIVKKGTGLMVLTANNTGFGGSLDLQAGTLSLGDGGTSGTIKGNVVMQSGTSLVFNRSNAHTFAGDIATNGGMGAMYVRGGGSLTMTGDATGFYGTVAVSGNSSLYLAPGAMGAFFGENTGIDVAAGSSVYYDHAGSYRTDMLQGAGNVTIRNGGQASVRTSNTGFTGNLYIKGNSTVSLDAQNAARAATVHVDSGTLKATVAASLNNVNVSSGGTFLGNNTTIYGTLTINAGGKADLGTTAYNAANVVIDGGKLYSQAGLVATDIALHGGEFYLGEALPGQEGGFAATPVRATIDGGTFLMDGGVLCVNFLSGSLHDAIVGQAGAELVLTGGTINLINFSYEGDGAVFEIFSGFVTSTIDMSGVTITGYDAANWTAEIDQSGNLVFAPASAIPEPSGSALLGFALLGMAVRRRR